MEMEMEMEMEMCRPLKDNCSSLSSSDDECDFEMFKNMKNKGTDEYLQFKIYKHFCKIKKEKSPEYLEFKRDLQQEKMTKRGL